jgi:hypothetical protein
VCAKDQESRLAFCRISRADVATPPAFAALPGPYRMPASWKTATAARVEGMLAPSPTASSPLRSSRAAASPSSSFCGRRLVRNGGLLLLGAGQIRLRDLGGLLGKDDGSIDTWISPVVPCCD